ncbi:CHRD domain-containing protein [Leptolyngbya ohadii]|uniref:CHRD domain-containing protein n=1 Tax=Leptolyngbya ohadii TaxID=1962290 RepID=UPI000B59D8E5|nr:CHRD domain-containing protein [Leptolyngbya ohadii]
MTDFSNHDQHNVTTIADSSTSSSDQENLNSSAGFTEDQNQKLTDALNQSFNDDHNHAPPENAGQFSLHISLDQVSLVRRLGRVSKERSLSENIGAKGDLLVLGGGDNVAIGSGSDDVIDARGGRLNTITTGTGRDTIILGAETTNRILDFDPTIDRLLIDKTDLKLRDLVLAQGKNPGKGGINQPLDSVSNALLIDGRSGHILASMPFVKAEQIFDDRNVIQLSNSALKSLKKTSFDNVQEGDGQLNGTMGRDKLVGGDGNDFLYVGDDGFRFNTARGGGGTEFPFPTDSPGTSELNAELKNGVLRVSGSYQHFDGSPLFSQGENEIDPKAKILNGSDPKALVDGFLKVPHDVEGNPISGTHLHFSPAGDDRGNFADATVIRYFENNPIDAKSGNLSGEFNLTPEEQAALLAGTLYVNIHSNIDSDGDGRAGFPTGENRLNFNRNVVQFT